MLHVASPGGVGTQVGKITVIGSTTGPDVLPAPRAHFGCSSARAKLATGVGVAKMQQFGFVLHGRGKRSWAGNLRAAPPSHPCQATMKGLAAACKLTGYLITF